MNTCNGAPISQADVDRTVKDLHSIFSDEKKLNLLPRNAALHIHLGLPGVAAVNSPLFGTTTVNADPLFLSCETKIQLKGVILHETGHAHDRLLFLNDHGQYILQIVLTFKMLSALWNSVARTFSKKHSPATKKNGLALPAYFVAASLNGAALLMVRQEFETRADLYSAYVMGTGKPLAEALAKFSTTHIDDVPNIRGGTRTSALTMFETYLPFAMDGISSFFISDHPDNLKRITYLENYRQAARPPFGMSIPRNYQQRITCTLPKCIK